MALFLAVGDAVVSPSLRADVVMPSAIYAERSVTDAAVVESRWAPPAMRSHWSGIVIGTGYPLRVSRPKTVQRAESVLRSAQQMLGEGPYTFDLACTAAGQSHCVGDAVIRLAQVDDARVDFCI